jgi:hypothetical protein
MLGKAVKFRHCPATVSAPTITAVLEDWANRWEFSQRLLL